MKEGEAWGSQRETAGGSTEKGDGGEGGKQRRRTPEPGLLRQVLAEAWMKSNKGNGRQPDVGKRIRTQQVRCRRMMETVGDGERPEWIIQREERGVVFRSKEERGLHR